MIRAAHFSIALFCLAASAAHADGVCTERPPTPDEQQLYSAFQAIFLAAAPAAPAGWSSEDSPESGVLGNRCTEDDNQPLPVSFQRSYTLVEGVNERNDAAMAAYADAFNQQQAMQEKNKDAIAAIDRQSEALLRQSMDAAQAQKFEDVQRLAEQQDALMNRKMELMGMADSQAATDQIQAEESRDREAYFRLSLEARPTGLREGEHFPTQAGRGWIVTYENNGVQVADVTIDFEAPGERYPVVHAHGDPARVRALVDAAALTAITQP